MKHIKQIFLLFLLCISVASMAQDATNGYTKVDDVEVPHGLVLENLQKIFSSRPMVVFAVEIMSLEVLRSNADLSEWLDVNVIVDHSPKTFSVHKCILSLDNMDERYVCRWVTSGYKEDKPDRLFEHYDKNNFGGRLNY